MVNSKSVNSQSNRQQDASREATKEIRLTVPGMGSDHCAGLIRQSLTRVSGIEDIHTNISNHKVAVRFQSSKADGAIIQNAIEQAGYEVIEIEEENGSSQNHDSDSEDKYLSRAWKRFVIAGVPASLIMVLMGLHMLWQPIPGYLAIVAVLAFPVVFLYGGWATHQSAWRSLLNRTANMDVLISMGSLPPYLIGLVGFFFPMTSFIEMAATIMMFHLLGRYLEVRAKGRASQAIKKLVTMAAKTAIIMRDGKEVEIPVSDLQLGDVMVVRPGGKIPTDGEVIDGVGHIDESIATGESVPVEKGPGDAVLGATINQEGFLKIKVTKLGADTFLSQVIKLIEEAQSSKVPIQEFADRLTSYFVPAVLLIAVVTFGAWMIFADELVSILWWGADFLPWINPELSPVMLALLAMISVLVIACPCALGLATPTALMVGGGVGAERGILIRSGEAIQTLKDIEVVVLDKTGTITEGKPSLTDVVAASGFNESEVLGMAASVEIGSEHPLAQALVQGAQQKDVDIRPVTNFESVTARGVMGMVGDDQVIVSSKRLFDERGIDTSELGSKLTELENMGKTVVLVAINNKLAGLVAVADTIKADSKSAISAIHKLGIRVVMVTGDNERAAKYIAAQVGLDEVKAGVLPEGKVDAIKELQAQYGQKVAMVGDGINDAPALKQANVGIAIGAGADVAIESADVTLVTGELTKVVEAIKLSKAIFSKIVQNMFWAWFYNGAAIPIAAIGLLHPMIGVVAMTASSLSVIGNSLLLKKSKL